MGTEQGPSLLPLGAWGGIAACSALLVVIVAVLALKIRQNRQAKPDPRSLSTRARLFSRDRLDTTEYMNNLATLDRKLAMDEILEKRRRVIFPPAVSCELRSGDDVFLDVITPIDVTAEDQPASRLIRKQQGSDQWTLS